MKKRHNYHRKPGFKRIIISAIAILLMLPSRSQDNTTVFYLCKGQVFYKKEGKWLKAYDGLLLNDTAWIKSESNDGQYLLKKNDKCAVVRQAGILQIGTIGFSLCDNSKFFFHFLEDLDKRINPSKKVYPVFDIYASNDRKLLRFPANGERLLSREAITFQGGSAGSDRPDLLWVSNPGSDSWGAVARDDSSGGGRRWLYKTVTSDSVTVYKTEIEKYFNDNITGDKLLWSFDSNKSALEFRFAAKKEIDQLNEKLRSLDSVKQNFDESKYLMARAFIYEDFKMYSEANRTYLELINQYPDSRIAYNLYGGFLNEIEGINRK